MDIIFKCDKCEQQLSADELDAGREIECPSCGNHLVVPAAQLHLNPMHASAAAKEEKHFKVPTYDATPPSTTTIEKPLAPLDVAAKDTDKKIRVKTLRHSDSVEVGKDLFDEHVSKFLQNVGQDNIVSIQPISYTHMDLATRQWITDYGVMVVYKG